MPVLCRKCTKEYIIDGKWYNERQPQCTTRQDEKYIHDAAPLTDHAMVQLLVGTVDESLEFVNDGPDLPAQCPSLRLRKLQLS